jgi:hypothetical protein
VIYNRGRRNAEGEFDMSKRRNTGQSKPADATPPATKPAKIPKRKDENWDDRLRRVGDANYVAVDWSPHDKPNWPLPSD